MKTDFKLFLQYFPPVDLPVLLGEDEHHVFSAENEVLPIPLIQHYILNISQNISNNIENAENVEDEGAADDMVEYVPCFQISNMPDCHALVYWKADFLDYTYVLATFDDKGRPIDRKELGGMRIEGQTVRQSVTQIDEDGFIIIAEGAARYEPSTVTDFDAEEGVIRRFELCNDGKILPILAIDAELLT